MTAIDAVTRSAQRRLGQALRARVAGDDAPDRARVIWGKPGERWFSPADPVWRVHADAAMFPGGVAALLLQSLHPSAMAGVAGHSGYRGDPWGRLQRTSHFLATTTFGTVEDAEATIARVRSIHDRVRGRDDRGRPYRASDPDLLRWVHVAEAWSFLAAYQRFAASPLGVDEADAYVEQAGLVARRLGATEVPTTVRGLDAAIEAYRPVLRASDAARDAARFLLLDPPLPWTARPGYGLIAAGGVATLPDWARRELRLPVPAAAARAAGVLGLVGTRTVRWAMAGVAQERQVAGAERP
ncbi:oxygenase MpaB family protein [uncultured Phycicoccus sp.]|uniref:oxygenase MpaB family protein n=1 Tax=uncultured Phycicoccus sp. TaxID=661422 RepID=UPI0026087F97|nr:oxygenase MpaB family protein [uncultured Phycicoccus sp.]